MNGDTHEDDRDPLAGLDWADNDADPFCEHCADRGWVTVLLPDDTATTKPCERC